MSINGLHFLEVRHSVGRAGYIVHIAKERDQPREEKWFDTKQDLLAFLRTQKLIKFTPEEVFRQIDRAPFPDEKMGAKFIVTAEA